MQKDRKALEYLYDHYSAALFGIISRIVPAEEMAQEVLQDCFLKIWDNIKSFDPVKGKLFTWMAKIARNLAIDKTRSRDFKSQLKSDSPEDYSLMEKNHFEPSINSEAIDVKDIVSGLNQDQKQLIDLMYFRGYTQAEISKEFDIPLGTVKSKVRLGMNKLRSIFNI
ncbi:RNA polymerase sigma factor [Flexithrix dorotheae]|uniref:RNA polymerase sigma factor n=1 Tax=Flexithrix dorotheae TaxID=70993 RepID=UPI00035F3461|nr:sigma-70 family RNA polymerase sigma factor [Flexithrix dorotheae]